MTETKTPELEQPKPTPEQKERDEARKKARDEAEKANDELIKKYKEEQSYPGSEAAEQLAKDQEKAEILNKIYNEKYAPGVRETEAQKNAREAQEKGKETKETKETHDPHEKEPHLIHEKAPAHK